MRVQKNEIFFGLGLTRAGATYPDIELLPALARTLKIDVNTLLCFKMELSDIEISQFLKKISEVSMSGGIEKGFALAEKKICEYPTDVKLIYSLAVTLQGQMMFANLSEIDREKFDLKIQQMYETVGKSGNAKYANQSNYMLASRAIADKKYEYANELIERLPESSTLDREMLQAKLWMETEKEKEAENIYASKSLSAINQIQVALVNLIRLTAKNGDKDNSSRLVEAGKNIVKAFGMWEYNACIFDMEKSMAEKDIDKSIENLDNMISAMLTPWDVEDCVVYKYIAKDKKEPYLNKKMLAVVLEDLEESEKYSFMRSDNRFEKLILQYKKMLS